MSETSVLGEIFRHALHRRSFFLEEAGRVCRFLVLLAEEEVGIVPQHLAARAAPALAFMRNRTSEDETRPVFES